MAVVERRGAILDAKEDFIVHQCNCCMHRCKLMGIEADIYNKFPESNPYSKRDYDHRLIDKPGTVFVQGRVISLFGQFVPGEPLSDVSAIAGSEWEEQFLAATRQGVLLQGVADTVNDRLGWFKESLQDLVLKVPKGASVAIPRNIGCDIAGSNWQHYLETIDQFARAYPQLRITVVSTTETAAATMSGGSVEEDMGHAVEETTVALTDVSFVFDMYDSDRDGILHLFQTVHALRSFGLAPKLEMLKDLVPERINKDDFERLLRQLQKHIHEKSTLRCVETIPHALRGIKFSQLEQVEHVFLSSGWLKERCNEWNSTKKAAIEAGRERQQKENLHALNRFVVSALTKVGASPARDRADMFGIPQAGSESSYSELLNPTGVVVHWLVSHAWDHSFRMTMQALRKWAHIKYRMARAKSPQDVVFWICLFSLNQHRPTEEVGPDPEAGPFNAVVQQAKHGAVMVVDQQLAPFKRIWCLFEVHRVLGSKKSLELICADGPLSTLVEDSPAGTDKQEHALSFIRGAGKSLQVMSAHRAEASNNMDKLLIWKMIIDGFARNVPLETLQRRRMFDRDDSFRSFDSAVRGLLSTTLLKAETRLHHIAANAEATIEWCKFGAAFTDEDLDTLDKACVLHAFTLPALLHAAACCGNDKQVKMLLDRNVDLEQKPPSPAETALVGAAGSGRDTTVKILLDHRADIEGTEEQTQRTALIAAARNGHASVVQTLLEHIPQASLEAATDIGRTPLNLAAGSGHVDCVKLLLSYRAEVEVQMHDGYRPLHLAALNDHVRVVELILESRADIDATTEKKGSSGNKPWRTSLMCAAKGGHLEVVQLLLKRRANHSLKADDGMTATSLALDGSSGSLCKLLLTCCDQPSSWALQLRQLDNMGSGRVSARTLIDLLAGVGVAAGISEVISTKFVTQAGDIDLEALIAWIDSDVDIETHHRSA